MLTIDTKHPCGNLVHERELLNLTWGENGSLLSVTKSSEQTKKSRKSYIVAIKSQLMFPEASHWKWRDPFDFQTGFSGFCACK